MPVIQIWVPHQRTREELKRLEAEVKPGLARQDMSLWRFYWRALEAERRKQWRRAQKQEQEEASHGS